MKKSEVEYCKKYDIIISMCNILKKICNISIDKNSYGGQEYEKRIFHEQ